MQTAVASAAPEPARRPIHRIAGPRSCCIQIPRARDDGSMHPVYRSSSNPERVEIGAGGKGKHMRLSTDRILTTHVGSMPRPQKLVDALLRMDHGETYDVAEFDKIIKDAIAAVVARQVAVGIDIPSDGEAS